MSSNFLDAGDADRLKRELDLKSHEERILNVGKSEDEADTEQPEPTDEVMDTDEEYKEDKEYEEDETHDAIDCLVDATLETMAEKIMERIKRRTNHN